MTGQALKTPPGQKRTKFYHAKSFLFLSGIQRTQARCRSLLLRTRGGFSHPWFHDNHGIKKKSRARRQKITPQHVFICSSANSTVANAHDTPTRHHAPQTKFLLPIVNSRTFPCAGSSAGETHIYPGLSSAKRGTSTMHKFGPARGPSSPPVILVKRVRAQLPHYILYRLRGRGIYHYSIYIYLDTRTNTEHFFCVFFEERR